MNIFCKNIILINEIIKSNFARLKLPYKLTFALTYNCNLMCKTCFIWGKKSRGELSTQEIENFFKRSNRFSWISLTGGEIFTRSDLMDIVKIILNNCKSLGILHFPTNGQFPDKTSYLVRQIRKHNKQLTIVVTVSMDGPEDANDEIRGSKGAWLKSLETFISLRRLGLRFVYFGYTISKYNQGKLADTLSAIRGFYPEVSYNDMHINIFQKSGHYFNNLDSENLTIDDSIMRELKQYLRQNTRGINGLLERRFITLIPKYAASMQIPIRCQALSASCFIDPYGDIYPCTIFDEKLANISDINNDLYGFWNGADAIESREKILNSKCSGCWTACEAYPALLGTLLRVFPRTKYKKSESNKVNNTCYENI